VSGPKGAAAAAAEDPTDAAAAVGVAHGRVVSSLMRKHLVGVVVPIALQLKRQLEAARHPLLGDLMLALASLLADHKHEVGFEVYDSTTPPPHS
jgi:condensin-2 complex subunit D3